MVIIDLQNCTAWYHLPVLLRSCENPWFLGFNGNEQIKTVTQKVFHENIYWKKNPIGILMPSIILVRNLEEFRKELIYQIIPSISCGIGILALLLKVSLFQNYSLMSKIFQNCKQNIVKISVQKYKKCLKTKK